MEHTEEADHHTDQEGGQSPEAVIEAPLAKPRKKMTYTPEQLERKRESMKKAREFRNISYKEENKSLKKKLEEKEKQIETEEEVEEEPEHEPVKRTVIKTRPKPKPKKRIVYEEEEEEEEEEEYEEVIVRRRPKNISKQKQYIERPDLVEETYKEKLQKQLQDERRRQVMAELFDF